MDENPYRATQHDDKPPKQKLAQLIWHWIFVDISPQAILLPFLIMLLVVMAMLALIFQLG